MAKRVRSGQVFINNYGAGGGVELPFGGVKSSGYGREKGFEALYGFTTLKTVADQARLAIGSPPGYAHFVSIRHPPRRGRHQRLGKAGSAVSHEGDGENA
jgi:hypothetical protein